MDLGPAPEHQPAAPASAPATIPELELFELDGIPLAFLPMPGPTILTLAFGVGRAHESAVRAGMTHLVEHLVMTRVAGELDRALDHANGSTEPFRVTFTMGGTPAEVSAFLTRICRAIEQPPLTRIGAEVTVLRTEAAGRPRSGFAFQAAFHRTGLQGLGLQQLPELFLERPDAELLRAWIAQHFTTGNAAIWVAGTLPDDLLVSLPPGQRTPLPPYREIDGLRTPTMVGIDGPGFAVSFRGPRSTATTTALQVLDRWLRRAIRVDNALGYDVGHDYLPVGPDEAIAATWVSCLPEKWRDVSRTLLGVIDDLAARGPTDADLVELHRGTVTAFEHPMIAPTLLDAWARDTLMGAPTPTPAALVEEQRVLEPDHVVSVVRQLRDSMLYVVPSGSERPQRHFEGYPGPMASAIGPGRTFQLKGKSGRNPFAKVPVPTLTVGAAGVVVRDPAGTPMTAVPWADAVAVVHRLDGSRLLLARDGFQVVINPGEWRDGPVAIGLVDLLSRPELVVRVTA